MAWILKFLFKISPSFNRGSKRRCLPRSDPPSVPVTRIISPTLAPERLIGFNPASLPSMVTLIHKGLSPLIISPPTIPISYLSAIPHIPLYSSFANLSVVWLGKQIETTATVAWHPIAATSLILHAIAFLPTSQTAHLLRSKCVPSTSISVVMRHSLSEETFIAAQSSPMPRITSLRLFCLSRIHCMNENSPIIKPLLLFGPKIFWRVKCYPYLMLILSKYNNIFNLLDSTFYIY